MRLTKRVFSDPAIWTVGFGLLGAIRLDIDQFKSVNDTYGHLFGDRILTSVAGVVGSVLREGDI